MPTYLQPHNCPDCGAPLEPSYAQRAKAVMPPGAKLLLTAGILTSIILVPLLFALALQYGAGWTERLGLRRRERGVVVAIPSILSIPVALLPALLCGRYAFSRPRRLTVRCAACPWAGTCRILCTLLQVPASEGVVVSNESEYEGIPIQGDQIRRRLQRLKERQQRNAYRTEEEGEPNPELDFER